MIREAKPIRLPDLTQHPDSYGFPPHHPPMHSFLGVPIVGKRGVFGNLYLTEKLGGATFTEEDEHIAVLLAANTAAAVENARLHEESARLLEEVQQLHRNPGALLRDGEPRAEESLAAVYGWAEMMVRKKDPATVPKAAFEVLDSAKQAVGLINDLLDLSRLDEDRLKPVIRATEPGSMARRAVARVTPAAEAKRVLLQAGRRSRFSELRDRRQQGRADPGQLAGQCDQPCPGGQHRAPRGRPPEQPVVRLHRVDQGSGIEESEVERIFDIYISKDVGDTRGVGLGLPLSRRLARLLGWGAAAVSRPHAAAAASCWSFPPARGQMKEAFMKASAGP